MNVGASAPEEAGQYFSWGNTDGHTPGDGYEFTQARYNNTPGVELSGDIPISQDAARVNMGGSWRIPTKTEFQELLDNCTYLWTTQNGVAGILFTSRINGSSIFFPAVGDIYNGKLEGIGEFGSNWSATIGEGSLAFGLYSSVEETVPDYEIDRFVGCTIRAVQSS